MIPHPNIIQDFKVEQLYLKYAVIKGDKEKNILISWGDAEEDYRLQNNNLDSIKATGQNMDVDSKAQDESEHVNKEIEEKIEKEDKTGEENKTDKGNRTDNSNAVDSESITNEQGTKSFTKEEKDNKKKGSEVNINTMYGISVVEAFNFQLAVGGKVEKNGKWVSATPNEIQSYFVPTDANIKKYKFQFLNLASLAGIGEAEAKAFLNGKGILSGKEKLFIEAAKANNINEIYLMAHACLETGNGTSQLAKGINYKGKTVYNMFGIHAVDSDPIGQGAAYAYKMGWDTPEKAILGGAQFISKQYINNYPYNQDTLYEMRWNPANPGQHQYATDIAWATKQAEKMEEIYASFKTATITFDIPKYR